MNSDTRTTGERVAQPATAGEAAGRVAEASKQQAGSVVDEVKDQTRNLVEEARTEATDQTRQQRDRAVQSLRSLGQELRGMADRSEQKGTGAELARQGAQRLESVAGFLQDREPGQVLDEVRTYARCRPGVFLAGALVAGAIVGRLTRGVVDSHSNESKQQPTQPNGQARTGPPLPPAPMSTRRSLGADGVGTSGLGTSTGDLP
jgi:hypothetical protein